MAELDQRASTADEDRAREEQQITDASALLDQSRQKADAFSAELSELNRRSASLAIHVPPLKCSAPKHRPG